MYTFSAISSENATKGTIRPMLRMNDIEVGATVNCQRAIGNAKRGKDYTVTQVSTLYINIECGGVKHKIATDEFIDAFGRRQGPVVPESIQRGLIVRVTTDTSKCSKGDVITLTEAGGTVYDCKTDKGRKAAIAKQELTMCCVYL